MKSSNRYLIKLQCLSRYYTIITILHTLNQLRHHG